MQIAQKIKIGSSAVVIIVLLVIISNFNRLSGGSSYNVCTTEYDLQGSLIVSTTKNATTSEEGSKASCADAEKKIADQKAEYTTKKITWCSSVPVAALTYREFSECYDLIKSPRK